MRKPKVTTLFLDIGGVLLSNGWDRNARAAAASEFGFPFEEMNLRHDQTFGIYEEGQINLVEYLERAVFFKERPFTRDEFKAFMFAQSKPRRDMLEFVRRLKKRFGLKTVAVSNEGRELAVYRNEKFDLPGLVDFFCCSCFIRMRKPDAGIYRLALDLAQVRAPEVVYVENTEMFADVARGLGVPTIYHQGFESTVAACRELGLTLD
jgi:putative hydrolase of the HAD superfamily